ncbi:MAG: methionine synthase [Clostridia bacterium]|nr:methionine synthase [Clostridia bacterium]
MSCNLNEKEETLRMLGVRGEADPQLELQVEEALRQCHEVARPRYVYGIFDLTFAEDAVILQGCSMRLEGKDIREHLDGCEKCALLATTIGSGIDSAILRAQAVDMSQAVILDAAAGVVADRTADRCEEEIRRIAESIGCDITFRYSPGYGDFPIECQPEFLGVLNAGTRLGLTATQSCMLLPTKSITAVIGLRRSLF